MDKCQSDIVSPIPKRRPTDAPLVSNPPAPPGMPVAAGATTTTT